MAMYSAGVVFETGSGAGSCRADVVAVEMDGRGHDVARGIAGELEDEFTEVGLHHLDSPVFEVGVEVDLLGHHRLRLHHQM